MSKLKRTALVTLVVLLPAVYTGTATAKTRHTKSATKTFLLRAGLTKTYNVGYPFALKYGNAKYSGKVRILPPASTGQGSQNGPILGKVKILFKGSAEGGSVYRVKVKNGNASGTTAVRVRITATTTWYS